MLIYAGSLSDAERVAVEQYLNNKWAYVEGPSGISLTVSAHTTQEGYLTPVQVNVTRPDTQGDLTVNVALGGTATYGVDYLAYPWDGSGTVTIPNGANSTSFGLYLIPDSRAEGGETVTATIQTGSYTILAPSSQTITITDDDQNVMPANGWQLISVEPQYVTASYAFGINTVWDGGTGWRGQVAGASSGYYGNSQTNFAFSWNNGATMLRRWPLSYDGSWVNKWSVGNSINAIGTMVGHVGHYGYGGWNGYWQRPAFWGANQTSATELSVITDAQNPLNNSAVDINQRDDPGANAGVIVGHCATLNGKVHAVAWIPDGSGNYGAYTELQDLSGFNNRYSYAGAINNNGIVVGKSQIASGNNYHAFRSTAAGGIPQQLTLNDDMGTATGTDADTSEGNDINDLGEMVGASTMADGQYRAVYKVPGSGKNAGYYDLGVLGEGTPDAGNSSVAYAIGARGLIVGKS